MIYLCRHHGNHCIGIIFCMLSRSWFGSSKTGTRTRNNLRPSHDLTVPAVGWRVLCNEGMDYDPNRSSRPPPRGRVRRGQKKTQPKTTAKVTRAARSAKRRRRRKPRLIAEFPTKAHNSPSRCPSAPASAAPSPRCSFQPRKIQTPVVSSRDGKPGQAPSRFDEGGQPPDMSCGGIRRREKEERMCAAHQARPAAPRWSRGHAHNEIARFLMLSTLKKRKSRRIAVFLMLSTSKNQNCLVLHGAGCKN